MYRKNPHRSWYYIVGCDTYLNVDYALQMLSRYDGAGPRETPTNSKSESGSESEGQGETKTKSKGGRIWWVAQYSGKENMENMMIPSIEQGKWPNYEKGKSPNSKVPRKYEWTSGGMGWFLSNEATRLYADSIDKFLKDYQVGNVCYCPDKITGLLLSLLGISITTVPKETMNSMQSWAADSAVMGDYIVKAKDFMIYHYMSPRKMILADWRAQHEKLDRMVNTVVIAQQSEANSAPSGKLAAASSSVKVQAVIDYFRRFIDQHFRLLLDKQVQIKYLAKHTKLPNSWGHVPGDIPDAQ